MYSRKILALRSDRAVNSPEVMQFDCTFPVPSAANLVYVDIYTKTTKNQIIHDAICPNANDSPRERKNYVLLVGQIVLFTRIHVNVEQASFLNWSTRCDSCRILSIVICTNDISFVAHFPNVTHVWKHILVMQCFACRTLQH